MLNELNPTWKLENIFPGGSESEKLEGFLEQLEEDLLLFQQKISGEKVPQNMEEAQEWSNNLDRIQDLEKRIREASAFVSCLTAQNVKDQKAKLLLGRLMQISSSFASLVTSLDHQILSIPQDVWEELLEQNDIKPISFPLEERRTLAKEKLPHEQEKLVNDLAVDGYHAWEELYNTVVGRISIPFEQDGKKVDLSVGQAQNKMSDGDRDVRKEIFKKWEEAWGKDAELCAHALNHLAGFRINLYKNRKWDSILKEPLDYNRMTEQTLNTMWKTIDQNKDIFVSYLQRKAKLLGLNHCSWYDLDAPLSRKSPKISYDKAAQLIVDQFHRFSPKMAEFAKTAFQERWIEAEDRPGKRPGGFCTSFPLTKESRIFMTYGGTASGVSTLAHELGHAYHQHVMNDLPQMIQNYAMNVAETASTFAEMIVADASVKHAKTTEEKINLLEDKIQNSIAFLMNIHARFIFELSFYEERKKGLVSVERLNELMEEAQKKAYRDSLETYHPYFWASKLHFYITEVPFYNFPYTFGYLFSAGIYARALQEGSAFEEKYVSLLRDTGRMKVEDLAARHLGVDLTKPDFWQSAIDIVASDVREFLRLTE
ncbi:M3 family oligoendopeptidase [Microaerobacter geothermalis]|uniref:M3 family oligoendopeptidase n=1 Tax=Microaerobacter geothermalis TaxID=674972 RepID=UPI001F3C7CD9|nr:M3 family oligoendopeptidase [Microaerobacter geothermalis]MCF6094114.1 M3 family oligoendopeptidase [Microaerobacter geothermalis]